MKNDEKQRGLVGLVRCKLLAPQKAANLNEMLIVQPNNEEIKAWLNLLIRVLSKENSASSRTWTLRKLEDLASSIGRIR